MESYGSLKRNQELISQMFLQIQTELNLPNRSAEEQEATVSYVETQGGSVGTAKGG